jgi:hypothetical protein
MSQATYNLWALIVQATASLGVLITLLLIWKQIKLQAETLAHNSRNLELTAFQSAASNLMEVGKLFVDRPQFRKYFYEGVPVPPNSPDYEEAKALAIVLMDFTSDMAVYAEHYSHLYPRETWLGYVRDMFQSSPIMREVLSQLRRDGKKWYTDEFYETMVRASGDPHEAAVQATVLPKKPSAQPRSTAARGGPGQK